MESLEGKQFYKIFKLAAQDAYSDWRLMIFESANAIVREDLDDMKDMEDKALDITFQSIYWNKEVGNMTRDFEAENERLEESRPLLYKPYTPLSCRELGKSNKKPCVWHMRESSLNKMIESALEKEACNNLEQMIDKKATKMSGREFYLSVDNN